MNLVRLPRTLFTRGSAGSVVLVRRFQDSDATPFYEVYGYTGDLAFNPRPLALPEDAPDQFPTLADACRYGGSLAGDPDALFTDVTQDRRVRIDIINAVRSLDMSPLYLGIPAEEVTRLFGVPESAQQLWERDVCWLYGSVQVHLDEGRLTRLEIDAGVSDFTSLYFDNWFLQPGSKFDDVAAHLESKMVRFRRVTRYGAPALEMGQECDPQFVIDFHPESSTVHALYWGALAEK
jgi:hypothetical protein